jgi:hypothetical protein
MADDWPFTDPENLAVFTLKRIVRGETPILRVSHDEDDGGWQFVDGGRVAIEEAALVSLRQMTRIDPSILGLADLPIGWVAERNGPGEPWQRSPAISEEDRDRKLLADIEEIGWHVILIPEGDDGPPFAYTIGLFRTFEHPEIIIFGLDLDLMHQMINLIGEEIRQGRRFSDGESASGILEGYDVRFLHVGDAFAILQCLWPDRQGRFPTDAGYAEPLRARQPLLAE